MTIPTLTISTTRRSLEWLEAASSEIIGRFEREFGSGLLPINITLKHCAWLNEERRRERIKMQAVPPPTYNRGRERRSRLRQAWQEEQIARREAYRIAEDQRMAAYDAAHRAQAQETAPARLKTAQAHYARAAEEGRRRNAAEEERRRNAAAYAAEKTLRRMAPTTLHQCLWLLREAKTLKQTRHAERLLYASSEGRRWMLDRIAQDQPEGGAPPRPARARRVTTGSLSDVDWFGDHYEERDVA